MNRKAPLSGIVFAAWALAACDERVAVRLEALADASVSDGSVADASILEAGTDGSTEAGPPDASVQDASVQDASMRDTSTDGDAGPRSRVVFFPRHGAAADDTAPPLGPGLLLDSGGGSGIYPWMHDTVVGGPQTGGDLVVLTVGGDASGEFLNAAAFHSVQAIAIPPNPTAAEYAEASAIVAKAEIVWFPGGDQAAYVRWKGSSLTAAVQGVYDRGGVIGGTSAGMIILGGAVNDAFNTLSENITTDVCLANPFDAKLHFTRDLFRFAPLAGAITDPHFIARNRMGRLVTFMARQVTDTGALGFRGVAVDDGAALAIDKFGIGKRIADGTGPAVYVVDGGSPTQAVAGSPLQYRNLREVRLTSAAHSYSFSANCGRGFVTTFDVDGTTPPNYYSPDPYTSGTEQTSCP